MMFICVIFELIDNELNVFGVQALQADERVKSQATSNLAQNGNAGNGMITHRHSQEP